MKYRQLGRTGVSVSELIFGCGSQGGIMINAEPAEMEAAAHRAITSGVNWFDTAPQYGDGVSETNLGRILKDLDEKPFVSTKVRLSSDNTDDIFGHIERALHESLERLQVDKIDLYQLHNGVTMAGDEKSLSTMDVLGREGAFDAMEKLRNQGLFKFIGMTALGDTGLCRRMIESGRIDVAQVYFNVVNPTASHPVPRDSFGQSVKKPSSGQDFTGLLEACDEWNVGVIAIRTLAAGALADPNWPGTKSILTTDTTWEEDKRKAAAVMELCGDAYGTPAQTATKFALSFPAVSCVDFAVGNMAELEDTLAIGDNSQLPEDALDKLNALYNSDFAKN